MFNDVFPEAWISCWNWKKGGGGRSNKHNYFTTMKFIVSNVWNFRTVTLNVKECNCHFSSYRHESTVSFQCVSINCRAFSVDFVSCNMALQVIDLVNTILMKK